MDSRGPLNFIYQQNKTSVNKQSPHHDSNDLYKAWKYHRYEPSMIYAGDLHAQHMSSNVSTWFAVLTMITNSFSLISSIKINSNAGKQMFCNFSDFFFRIFFWPKSHSQFFSFIITSNLPCKFLSVFQIWILGLPFCLNWKFNDSSDASVF